MPIIYILHIRTEKTCIVGIYMILALHSQDNIEIYCCVIIIYHNMKNSTEIAWEKLLSDFKEIV